MYEKFLEEEGGEQEEWERNSQLSPSLGDGARKKVCISAELRAAHGGG